MFFKRVAQSPPVKINGVDVTEHRGPVQSVLLSSCSTMLTFDIFHDHAQVSPRLKGAVHGHHKGVLSKGEDVSLHEGLLYLIP